MMISPRIENFRARGHWQGARGPGTSAGVGLADVTQLILDDHHEQQRLFSTLAQVDRTDTASLSAVCGAGMTATRVVMQELPYALQGAPYPRGPVVTRELRAWSR
jgi:hypothetical protein